VAAGEHRHHEPALYDALAFALGHVLVLTNTEVEGVREVEGVLGIDHAGRDEARRLDEHQEGVEVVLVHDL